MAAEAARRALEDGNVRAEEVDLLIVCTFTSEVLLPCAACEVQKELGAVHAACFDLNAACTGFLFAYNTAQAYIAAGLCRTALLIGSESLSNMVNWKDRGTCILFGDGAGAAVLKAEPGELPSPVMHSDGASGGALTLMSRHRKGWAEEESAGRTPTRRGRMRRAMRKKTSQYNLMLTRHLSIRKSSSVWMDGRSFGSQ